MKACLQCLDADAPLWIHLSPADIRLAPASPGPTFFNDDNGLRAVSPFVPGVPGKNQSHPEGNERTANVRVLRGWPATPRVRFFRGTLHAGHSRRVPELLRSLARGVVLWERMAQRRQSGGTNGGTNCKLKITNLAFMRVSRIHSVDASPPVTCPKASNAIHWMPFFFVFSIT